MPTPVTWQWGRFLDRVNIQMLKKTFQEEKINQNLRFAKSANKWWASHDKIQAIHVSLWLKNSFQPSTKGDWQAFSSHERLPYPCGDSSQRVRRVAWRRNRSKSASTKSELCFFSELLDMLIIGMDMWNLNMQLPSTFWYIPVVQQFTGDPFVSEAFFDIMSSLVVLSRSA